MAMWTLDALLRVTDSEFEELVAALWADMGQEIVRAPMSGHDKAIDVIARTRTQPHITTCIQAKRYQPTNRVGVREIREYASLLRRAEIDVVAVVTTSSFTLDAVQEAAEHGVKLIDGDGLLGMLSASGLTAPSDRAQAVIQLTQQEPPQPPATECPTEARIRRWWPWIGVGFGWTVVMTSLALLAFGLRSDMNPLDTVVSFAVFFVMGAFMLAINYKTIWSRSGRSKGWLIKPTQENGGRTPRAESHPRPKRK